MPATVFLIYIMQIKTQDECPRASIFYCQAWNGTNSGETQSDEHFTQRSKITRHHISGQITVDDLVVFKQRNNNKKSGNF